MEGVRGRHRLTQYAVLRLRRSLINVTNPAERFTAQIRSLILKYCPAIEAVADSLIEHCTLDRISVRRLVSKTNWLIR